MRLRSLTHALNVLLISIFFSLFMLESRAQNYADPGKYLVDSLVLEDLTEIEQKVVDSCMLVYADAKTDKERVEALNFVIENMNHYKWVDYHYLCYDIIIMNLQSNLSPENGTFFKEKLAENYNNSGFIYVNSGLVDSALYYFEASLKLHEELGYLEGAAAVHNNMGYLYRSMGNSKEALEHYESSRAYFLELGSNSGLAMTLNNIAMVLLNEGDIQKAMAYLYESLEIKRKSGDKAEIAPTVYNIGTVLNDQGRIEEALVYLHESLMLFEEIGDDFGLSRNLNYLGKIYQQLDDYETAMEFHQKAKDLAQKINFQIELAASYNNIASVYEKKGDTVKALDNYSKALELSRELQNPDFLANILNNIGHLHGENGDQIKALEYFEESLSIDEAIGNKVGQATDLNNIAASYFDLGQLQEAENHASKSLLMAEKLGYPENIMKPAKILSQIYESQNRYEKALEMHKLYVTMQDSLKNEENKKAAMRQAAKYEYEKKKAIDDINHLKELSISAEHEKRQKLIIYAVVIMLVLTAIFSVLIFDRLRLTQKQKLIIEGQKDMVEDQNREIQDSINYAKRIQVAILPPLSIVSQNLDSFVYFRPKDVVAGDFYWFVQKLPNIYFAAADCTGHGVPGAMVSVVCNNALNRTVNEYNITEPAEILNKVRDLVLETFEQSDEEVNDGMDIAFCKYNIETRKITFSGAQNPLYRITPINGEVNPKTIVNESHMLIEYKGDKMPIGKYAFQKPFSQEEIQLLKGDVIYISSDGYADQFGGPQGRKFMYKPFKRLLLSIYNKNVDEQKDTLIKSFNEWKGGLEQVDDVCVIGVRVG